MNMIAPRSLAQDFDRLGTMGSTKQGVVAVVSDNPATIANMGSVCDFLDLRMEVVSTAADLCQVLLEHQPMAVIADVEGDAQDGFHIMKLIARHDADMAVMLLTGGDAVLMGAADAVQEMCGLTSVTLSSEFPLGGQLVAFLFSAGRRMGCLRLVPV